MLTKAYTLHTLLEAYMRAHVRGDGSKKIKQGSQKIKTPDQTNKQGSKKKQSSRGFRVLRPRILGFRGFRVFKVLKFSV